MDIALWKRTHSFTTQPLTQKGFYFYFYFFFIFYFNEGKRGAGNFERGFLGKNEREREREFYSREFLQEILCLVACISKRRGEIFIGIQGEHVALILLSTNCNTSCHLQKILHFYFPIFAFIYLFIPPPPFIVLDIVSYIYIYIYIYIMLYYYVLLSLIT